MNYKSHTEVLHETKHLIRGTEPFLHFGNPYMFTTISAGALGSHNLFDGRVEGLSQLKQGDTFAIQLVKLSQVPMTWRERVWSWVRRGSGYSRKV